MDDLGNIQGADEEGLEYPTSLRFDPSNAEYNDTLQAGEEANRLMATTLWDATGEWFTVLVDMDLEPLLNVKELLFPVRYTLAKHDCPAMENFMSSLNFMKHKESCHLDSQRRLILDPKHINEWPINDHCFMQVASVYDALIRQASFFAEGDCCLQEEAWSRAQSECEGYVRYDHGSSRVIENEDPAGEDGKL
jgi:hypothetical protein